MCKSVVGEGRKGGFDGDLMQSAGWEIEELGLTSI